MSLLAEMRGSENGAARQFGRAELGWAGLVGHCSLVMRHNWAKTRLELCLISSHVCLFVMGFGLLGHPRYIFVPVGRNGAARQMGWLVWAGYSALQPSNGLNVTRCELHLSFVSRIDRTRIDGWLARILIRSFCTRRENNFPISKRQVRCLNLELPITS